MLNVEIIVCGCKHECEIADENNVIGKTEWLGRIMIIEELIVV